MEARRDSVCQGHHYIGVDVGTQSVRAGVINSSGRVISKATHPITLHKLGSVLYQQSSEGSDFHPIPPPFFCFKCNNKWILMGGGLLGGTNCRGLGSSLQSRI